MMTRRRRIRIALTSALLAVITIPAVAATCYEQSSGTMGLSGFPGVQAKVEIGEWVAITCTSGKIKQMHSSATGVIFTCK